MSYQTSNQSKTLATTNLLSKHANQFNDFAISNFKESSHVSSPLSIYILMTLLNMGADNETFTELYQLVFREEVNSKSKVKLEMLKDMIRTIMSTFKMVNDSDKSISISLVNNFYLHDRLELTDSYQQILDNTGKIFQMDFNNTTTVVDTINNHISTDTNNLINNLLKYGDINNDTLMVLVNCLYFKPDWKYPFNHGSTVEAPFKQLSGETKTVEMMRFMKNQMLSYYENDEYQFVSLPYKNENFSFDIILPKTSSPTTLKNTSVDLLNMLVNSTPKMVYMGLPKFEQEYQVDGRQLLERNGIKHMFSNDADFSGISTNESLKVDKIIHKAVIKVNEKGTEAAAATVVTMMRNCAMMGSIPKSFIADHTFQYFIRYTPSNLILFSGQYDA
jgi:serine protease inhibitor